MPKVTAPYSIVDCIVAVYIFFIILALISDIESSTLSKFIFLSVVLSYVVNLFPESNSQRNACIYTVCVMITTNQISGTTGKFG